MRWQLGHNAVTLSILSFPPSLKGIIWWDSKNGFPSTINGALLPHNSQTPLARVFAYFAIIGFLIYVFFKVVISLTSPEIVSAKEINFKGEMVSTFLLVSSCSVLISFSLK